MADDNILNRQVVTNYWPHRGGSPNGIEGNEQTSRPGPGGRSVVSTLEDFRLGRSPYVTIASDPSRYGQSYTIPSYTYVNARGERHTLQNVPAYVHDTGSAFRGRPDKFDIAADYSTGDAHGARLDRANYRLNEGTVFRRTPTLADAVMARGTQVATGPRPGTMRYWEQGRAPPQTTQVAGADPGIKDISRQEGWGYRFGRFGEGGVKGLTVHNTGEHNDTVAGTLSTFHQRNFPAQYVMDRDGTIYRALPEGAKGQHMKNSWGPYAGRGNANMEGIEVVGADKYDDFTPAQMASMDRFAAWHAQKYGYDPRKNIFGHNEVNPGNKEPREGMQWVESFRQRYDAGQWKPGATQVAAVKAGTTEYWNSTAKAGNQVEVAKVSGAGDNAKVASVGPNAKATDAGDNAKTAYAGANAKVAAAPDAAKVAQAEAPRGAAPGPASQAGPKVGDHAYWNGSAGRHPSDAPQAQQERQIASAQNSRGNASGESTPASPYSPRSAMPPLEYGPDNETASSSETYGMTAGGVPEVLVIKVNVNLA